MWPQVEYMFLWFPCIDEFNPPPTPDTHPPPTTTPPGKLQCLMLTVTQYLHISYLYYVALNDLIGTEWSNTLHRIHVQPFSEAPGPVHDLGPDATPLDFFSLLWEPSFFDSLAEEINRYAQQRQVSKPNSKWYPATPEEMKAFIGVNIMMGIDQKPEISQYWSTDEYLGNVGIQRVFPRERFEHLTR